MYVLSDFIFPIVMAIASASRRFRSFLKTWKSISSILILQIQIDSAMLTILPKRVCLFFGVSNFESLIPHLINSEMEFLVTQTPATMIGPSKDPLPASSTPQMMLLLPVNSNPLSQIQDMLVFYPCPSNH